MAKPPKKPFLSKKPQKSADRKSAPVRAGAADKSSKRGSFRKSEAEHRGKKYVPASVRGKEERPARRHEEPREAKSTKIKADLFGFHAVREAWKNPGRFVHALYITESAFKEFEKDLATDHKRPAPTIVSKEDLDKTFPSGTVHQGIAMSCQALAELAVIDLIIKAQDKPKSVIVILDQVTDPHNVGAIMRSACAFGADGIVMQTRHTPDMAGILAKTACGAVEHLPVAYETNLSRAIEKLQEHHYTIIGLDEHAQQTFGDLYKYDRAVIVLGAEGPGMRRLIKEHCDVLVTLPTQKPINSLNVSNAAAVALYALTA